MPYIYFIFMFMYNIVIINASIYNYHDFTMLSIRDFRLNENKIIKLGNGVNYLYLKIIV